MVTRGWAGVGRRHRGPGCRRQEGQRAVSAEPFKSGASATGLARRRARDRRAARAAWRRHPRHCAGRGAIPYIHAGVGCARPTSTFFFFFLDWCGREPVAHMPWRPTRPRIVGDSLSKSGVRRSVPRSAPGWQGRASRGGGGGGVRPPVFFLDSRPYQTAVLFRSGGGHGRSADVTHKTISAPWSARKTRARHGERGSERETLSVTPNIWQTCSSLLATNCSPSARALAPTPLLPQVQP